MEWAYGGILLLTLIPSAGGGMKPVSPKTEEKSQVVDSCDIKRLLSCGNSCTIKISQARQSDCDWLGQDICCWEMGAEGLHLRRREGTYWSFALCSSAFINHWTLHCAVSQVEMAAAALHGVDSDPVGACQAGMWDQISSGRLGNVHLLILAWDNENIWTYKHENSMILRWSGNFCSQSKIHVGTLLYLSVLHLLDMRPVPRLHNFHVSQHKEQDCWKINVKKGGWRNLKKKQFLMCMVVKGFWGLLKNSIQPSCTVQIGPLCPAVL